MKMHLPGRRSCGCHCTVQSKLTKRWREESRDKVDQQRRRGKPDLFLAVVEVQKKPQCLLLKWNWPPGRQAQMVSHTSLSGGPTGSGRRCGHQGIGGPDLILTAPAGADDCSLFKLYEAQRAGMALWHWALYQACLCTVTAEQPAGWISPVRSCRRVARPSWREHMAHSCYQMPTSSTIASSKALSAKMWHLNLLQETFF